MLVVFIIISHFTRIAKEKVKMIIRTAIISKLRTSYAFVIVYISLNHNLSSISHSHSIESISSNESSNVDESFNDHETLMKNIQEII